MSRKPRPWSANRTESPNTGVAASEITSTGLRSGMSTASPFGIGFRRPIQRPPSLATQSDSIQNAPFAFGAFWVAALNSNPRSSPHFTNSLSKLLHGVPSSSACQSPSRFIKRVAKNRQRSGRSSPSLSLPCDVIQNTVPPADGSPATAHPSMSHSLPPVPSCNDRSGSSESGTPDSVAR